PRRRASRRSAPARYWGNAWRAPGRRRWPASIGFAEKPLDQPVGPAAVGEAEMAREVARRRGEVEALVLLVAAGQARACEVPGQPEDPDALLGGHALGARQIALDQRPQVLVGHLRSGRRGEKIVRADQPQDLVDPREPQRQEAAQRVQ